MKPKYLIVVGGPTASGKTNLAIQLAQHYKTVILSADSRQFYKEMSIGTAKPNPEELAAAPHYFINTLSIQEEYTVGDYELEALQTLENIYKEHDMAILAGGSGLFIRALCEGLDKFPEVSNEVREAIQQVYDKKGIEALQAELLEKDPLYYKEVDIQNARRLMRAIEVIRSSGQTFSSFRQKNVQKRPFQSIYVLINMDRTVLYDRINRRVDLMIEAGLLEEAVNLHPQKHLKSLQTVGYQEFFDYFDEKISKEEAIELVKRNSRRYAKRQMTWFRKREHWNSFDNNEVEQIIEFIDKKISKGLNTRRIE